MEYSPDKAHVFNFFKMNNMASPEKNGTANPGAQCTATASFKQAFLIAVSVLSYSASLGLLRPP